MPRIRPGGAGGGRTTRCSTGPYASAARDWATLVNGSFDGLDCFVDGRAALAGLHIPEDGGMERRDGLRAGRAERGARRLGGCGLGGLILSDLARGEVRRLSDLKGKRVAMRQPGGRSRRAAREPAREGGGDDAGGPAVPTPAARAYRERCRGRPSRGGDAGRGAGHRGDGEAVSTALPAPGRGAVRTSSSIGRAYFTDPVQTLLRFARADECTDKANRHGRATTCPRAGSVRWLSPLTRERRHAAREPVRPSATPPARTSGCANEEENLVRSRRASSPIQRPRVRKEQLLSVDPVRSDSRPALPRNASSRRTAGPPRPARAGACPGSPE